MIQNMSLFCQATRSASRITAIFSDSIRKECGVQRGGYGGAVGGGKPFRSDGFQMKTTRLRNFQEKPKGLKSNLASMGIYIFNWDILKKYLIEDENDPEFENDFGKNIIGACCVIRERCTHIIFQAIGRMSERFLLSGKPIWRCLDPENSGINLFDDDWRIYSRNSGMTGHRIGEEAVLENCMITDGCSIDGKVKHSVLFAGVKVEKGAVIEDAVIMGGSTIKEGAQIKHCIM